MEIILEGNSEYVAHAWRNIGLFGKKIRCVTALDLNKWTDQITMIAMCAPISGLPYYISIMNNIITGKVKKKRKSERERDRERNRRRERYIR